MALALPDDEEGPGPGAADQRATHFDPEAGDACVLWSAAIRHAVLTAELDAQLALRHISPDRRQLCTDVAESRGPRTSPTTAGWSPRYRPPGARLPRHRCLTTTTSAGSSSAPIATAALHAAVRAGDDTDTVAASPAAVGHCVWASAVPLSGGVTPLDGSGIRCRDLVTLKRSDRRHGRPDTFDFSYADSSADTLVTPPHDEGVVLGGIGRFAWAPESVRWFRYRRLADDDIHVPDIPQVEARLIDRVEVDENPHPILFCWRQSRAVEAVSGRGSRTVLWHCVGAYSRTPTVAALYGARRRASASRQALCDVQAALPGSNPNACISCRACIGWHQSVPPRDPINE